MIIGSIARRTRTLERWKNQPLARPELCMMRVVSFVVDVSRWIIVVHRSRSQGRVVE